MKKILLLMVLIIPLSFYAQEGNKQTNGEKLSKKEKKKIEREGRKKREKAKDSIHIIYDVGKKTLSKSPPYNLNDDGFLIFEIKDINLLRYSVSLNEFQNDIIGLPI